MTAVVGILNKRGIAIAADSAATITRNGRVKIENSANKMLRLSDVTPISIMIVGSARFLLTPWDIIVRRYRQKRGSISLPTVQAYIDDFFSHMATEKILFHENTQTRWLDYDLEAFWDKIVENVPYTQINKGTVVNKKQILHAFKSNIDTEIKNSKKREKLPAFKDYTIAQFKEYTNTMVDNLFTQKTLDLDSPFLEEEDEAPIKEFTEDILAEIKDLFVEGFFASKTCKQTEGNTHLIFSGYGENEDYPVMIRVMVSHGFDNRICYQINPEDIHAISDDNPVAICPYAQTDIMEALLTGIDPVFYEGICFKSKDMFEEITGQISFEYLFEEGAEEIESILKKVKHSDLASKFERYGSSIKEAEKREWLRALRNYSIQNMAHLAENLIAMTSFERHMTFSEEGVGGPIDLAVITKNNGFIWLNRKSWYHHKDVGGRYGKFGV